MAFHTNVVFSFQVDSLKEICEGVLLRNIDGDTVVLYLGIAEQFSVARLKVGAISERMLPKIKDFWKMMATAETSISFIFCS